jgi:hypothetical protein
MNDEVKWLIVGDFNLIRSPQNRNKPGGNISEMFAFNEAISKLSLNEIPLKGCKYTWSNKQQDPLLERLDWFFSSSSWISFLPNTWASALSKDTSDHIPCLVSASTKVPKPNVFRFENYWLQHHQFNDIFQAAWNLPSSHSDKAKRISSKFKTLRRILKAWKNQLPSLAKTIKNCKEVILFLDTLEENRDLSLEEWNFRSLVSQQLESLLAQEKAYWKQRGTVNWVKFGDECTKFFHANASIRHSRNSIAILRDDTGREIKDYEEKAELIWNSFKERLAISEYNGMQIDLSAIINPVQNLDWIESEFPKEDIDKVIAELPNNKSPGPDGFNGEFLKNAGLL